MILKAFRPELFDGTTHRLNDYYSNLSVFLINPSGSGQKGDLPLFQASLPPWPVHYEAVGKRGGERGVRCDREDSHLRVDGWNLPPGRLCF